MKDSVKMTYLDKDTYYCGNEIRQLAIRFESGKLNVEAVVSVKSQDDVILFQSLWDGFFESIKEEGRDEIRRSLADSMMNLSQHQKT